MAEQGLDPYVSFLGYTPLPVQIPRNQDTEIFALARLLDNGGGKFVHYAVRYEEHGKPHLPTYGLRIASDSFSRAAHLIFQESIPLPKILGIVLTATIKNAAIGIAAFSKALEDDWKMVKPYCGAHCQTCTANGFAEYFDALGAILAVANPNSIAADVTGVQQVCADAATALRSFVNQVVTSGSYEGTHVHWQQLASALDKLADRMSPVLTAGAP